MKKSILNLVIGILFLMFCACASQKEIKTSNNEIPETIYTTDDTVAQPLNENTQKEKTEKVVHVVQKGESLWVIAQKYGVTVKAIAEANNIENASLIKINQELIIPEKK